MAIGSDIAAKAMKHEGVTDFFYIMGAPMLGVEKATLRDARGALQPQLKSMIVTSGNPSRKHPDVVRIEGY